MGPLQGGAFVPGVFALWAAPISRPRGTLGQRPPFILRWKLTRRILHTTTETRRRSGWSATRSAAGLQMQELRNPPPGRHLGPRPHDRTARSRPVR